MTTFRLEKSTASTRALAKFNVLDDQNAICGVISVKPSAENDFLAHWKGHTPSSSPKKAANAKQDRSFLSGATCCWSRRIVLELGLF